jgi:hypothetical protein
MAEPRDQHLRGELRAKQARVQAVKRWLADHGHDQHYLLTAEPRR